MNVKLPIIVAAPLKFFISLFAAFVVVNISMFLLVISMKLTGNFVIGGIYVVEREQGFWEGLIAPVLIALALGAAFFVFIFTYRKLGKIITY